MWNWDSKTPAVYVLFVEAAIARPGLALGAGLDVNLTGWQTEAEGYFDKIVNNKKRRGSLTRGLCESLCSIESIELKYHRRIAVLRRGFQSGFAQSSHLSCDTDAPLRSHGIRSRQARQLYGVFSSLLTTLIS